MDNVRPGPYASARPLRHNYARRQLTTTWFHRCCGCLDWKSSEMNVPRWWRAHEAHAFWKQTLRLWSILLSTCPIVCCVLRMSVCAVDACGAWMSALLELFRKLMRIVEAAGAATPFLGRRARSARRPKRGSERGVHNIQLTFFWLTYWLAGYGAYFSPASHQNRDILTSFDSLTVDDCTLLFLRK
jgi:hypothetical protein